MNATPRFAGGTGHFPVVVIGAGQAGLSASYYLAARGIEHCVFEKNRIAYSWSEERWDSFCLVTPNWQCRLPDFPYRGDDPRGFMVKADVVAYVEAFARSFGPPVLEGVEVTHVRRRDGRYEIATSFGRCSADNIVVATGGYHIPAIPRLCERLPDDVLQMHSSRYTNPAALPDGAVLVVGSGQSGSQIAEDLHFAGRTVHLAVGSAPRSPRRYRGKDVVEWLEQMRYYDLPIHEHPEEDRIRARANHYLSGRDGGREIDLRRLALEGVLLHGRLLDVTGSQVCFGSDLERNLDGADAVAQSIRDTIDDYIARTRIDAPTEPPYVAPWRPVSSERCIDLAEQGITSVIWCNGYRTDFSWIQVPVFDGRGYPGHDRGITPADGLYFLGLPWLHTWGSGRLSGVARDALHVVQHIEKRCRAPGPSQPAGPLNALALGS